MQEHHTTIAFLHVHVLFDINHDSDQWRTRREIVETWRPLFYKLQSDSMKSFLQHSSTPTPIIVSISKLNTLLTSTVSGTRGPPTLDRQ